MDNYTECTRLWNKNRINTLFDNLFNGMNAKQRRRQKLKERRNGFKIKYKAIRESL